MKNINKTRKNIGFSLIIIGLLGLISIGLSGCSKSDATQIYSSSIHANHILVQAKKNNSATPITLRGAVKAPIGWKVDNYSHNGHIINQNGQSISVIPPISLSRPGSTAK